MTYEPWSYTDESGNATCLTRCDPGFTSNGDVETHVCVSCDETCAECMDNDEVGDTKMCTICSESHPFMFSQEAKCMESCDIGFFQINETAMYCDQCTDPCYDCAGDKFNCTLCDIDSPEKSLFSQELEINGESVIRGTCYRSCPLGYFESLFAAGDSRCEECDSPCATCEGTAGQCLSCDGTDDLRYVYNYDCHVECPNKTAPDMTTLRCVECGENCNECGS